MTRHRRLETGTWVDHRFAELSPAPPNAQTLWLYLLTGIRTTIFPGIVLARAAVMASDLGWPLHADLSHPAAANGCRCLMDAWREVEQAGMAQADWKAGVVVLPRALMHRDGTPRITAHPGSQNGFRGWAKSWPDVPQCELTRNYLVILREFACGLDRISAGISAELAGDYPKKRGRPRLQKKRHISYLETYEKAFGTALRSVSDRSSTGTTTAPRHTRVPDPDPVSTGDRDFESAQSSGSSPELGVGSGSGSGRGPKPPDAPVPARSSAPPEPAPTAAATPLPRRGYPLAGARVSKPPSLSGASAVAEVLPAVADPGGGPGMGAAASGTPAGPPLARGYVPGAVVPSAEAIAIRELGNRGWAKLNAIRAEMAVEFAWRDLQPLHPMDPGRAELNARLRESGASGEERLFHVLACAAAEARAAVPPTPRWLSGAVFGERQWRRYSAMRVADAAAPPGRQRSTKHTPAPEYAGASAALARERAAARAAPPEPVPIADSANLTDADRADLAELAEKLGITPIVKPTQNARPSTFEPNPDEDDRDLSWMEENQSSTEENPDAE